MDARIRLGLSGALLGLSLVVIGCGTGPVGDHRDAFLHNALIEDNRSMLERDPVATGGKFAKMAATLYNYFRGTATLYLSDMTQASKRYATSYGTASSGYIAALMDPHPENIGSFYGPGGQILIDFNDFDGARFAPYHFDVRRLALGFAALLTMVGTTEATAAIPQVVDAVVSGYLSQISSMQGAQQGPSLLIASTETIIADLVRRAKRDGDIKEALDEYTIVEGGQRKMRFRELEPPFRATYGSDSVMVLGDDTRDITADEKRLLDGLVQSYLALRRGQKGAERDAAQLVNKGWSRRLGAGVSSYPRLRYYGLFEGPSKSLDDDILLEFKELADPPPLPGLTLFPRRSFDDNATRVVWMQRQMQQTQQNDPYLGAALAAPMIFRARWRTKYQKNFATDRFLEKYTEGDWSIADLLAFAKTAGSLLARAHGQTKTLDERSGLDVIAAALGDKPEGLIQETQRVIADYLPQLIDDYKRFRALLETHGLRLGYRSEGASPFAGIGTLPFQP